MNRSINRRDFLKLAGLASLGMVIPPSINHIGNTAQGNKKNVLIIVFDAMSAYNLSLYGYDRETTPNLARLSKRATVFHNHFAGGNFTTPGTASILTGSLPWTHRAIRFGGMVKPEYADKSIFHAFNDYYRIAYSHNSLVDTLFYQFTKAINERVPLEELFLSNDGLIREVFKNDEDIATLGWGRAIKRPDGYSYSVFLSQLYEKYTTNRMKDIAKLYPYGLPHINYDNYFVLDQGIDTLGDRVLELPKPFLGYFHFLPPHSPYKPHKDFAGTFSTDSYKPLAKPEDPFTEEKDFEFLRKARSQYDEFVLNVDHEFGRLFEKLEAAGILEDTWLVFTSDHGEFFERGIWGHSTGALYQPVVRVPLIIFEPGVQTGRDVHTTTSAIDLMPTLLHLTGHEIPASVEGTILPPYASTPTPEDKKGAFTIQARFNEATYPLTQTSIMHVRDNYKMIYYLGYEELDGDQERFYLYDIEADPQELNELSQVKPETAAEMLNIIKTRLAKSNEPYL